ncbi:MAG: winged helix-turn-helix domain-containing protein [Acidobacteria bacterium]|nr:winged helix-turn-helix domain-containing protein [Acidobacteriota bacterium]
MSKCIKYFYEFGPYWLDCGDQSLWLEERVVPLTPKVFQVLLVLVERQGQVVEKDELMRLVWPDTFVEKGNLTQSISMLRKALDEIDPEKYIETVPRRGYRLTVPVLRRCQELESHQIQKDDHPGGEQSGRPVCPFLDSLPCNISEISQITPLTIKSGDRSFATAQLAVASKTTFHKTAFFMGMITVTVILTLAFIQVPLVTPTSKQKERPVGAPQIQVIVEPFKLVKATTSENLADGICDLLISKLRECPFVQPRLSQQQNVSLKQPVFWGENTSPTPEILVTGSIEAGLNRIAVGMKLSRIQDGSVIWSELYYEPTAPSDQMRENIAARLAFALQVILNTSKPVPPSREYTSNPEASEAFQKGRYFWNNRSHNGLMRSITYLQQAIDRDPQFARAYAALGDAYAFDLERWPEAEPMIEKAIGLDPTLAEPHSTLAFIRMFHHWNWNEAELEFQTALHLNPQHPIAHQWYAQYLATRGQLFEATVHLKKAYQLDPLSPAIATDLAQVYFSQDRTQLAIEFCQKALELFPDFVPAHQLLFEIYIQMRRYDDAVREYLAAQKKDGQQLKEGQSIDKVYQTSGIQGFLEMQIQQMKQVPASRAYDLAKYFAYLDDQEQTIHWLERAYEEHGFLLINLKIDPAFRKVRQHSQFQKIIQLMGL